MTQSVTPLISLHALSVLCGWSKREQKGTVHRSLPGQGHICSGPLDIQSCHSNSLFLSPPCLLYCRELIRCLLLAIALASQ